MGRQGLGAGGELSTPSPSSLFHSAPFCLFAIFGICTALIFLVSWLSRIAFDFQELHRRKLAGLSDWAVLWLIMSASAIGIVYLGLTMAMFISRLEGFE